MFNINEIKHDNTSSTIIPTQNTVLENKMTQNKSIFIDLDTSKSVDERTHYSIYLSLFSENVTASYPQFLFMSFVYTR